MTDLNKCCFIGRLGKDPEIRATQGGKEIANLTLAVGESWKDSAGQKQERTEWVRISVFSQGLVGVIKEYLHKGSKIYVEGKMQTRKWTDNLGVDKYTTEVVLPGFDSKLIMLDGKSSGESQPVEQVQELDDEIPF